MVLFHVRPLRFQVSLLNFDLCLHRQASVHEKYFAQLQKLEQCVHGVVVPSLTREQVGPSLQEMMRQLRRDHAHARGNDENE